jgi:hypothetical protein
MSSSMRMQELPFKLSDQPVWVPHARGLEIIDLFHVNCILWLDLGINFKYLDIRVDSRTGSMLISTTRQYEPVEFLN